jgi:hypothetical protein
MVFKRKPKPWTHHCRCWTSFHSQRELGRHLRKNPRHEPFASHAEFCRVFDEHVENGFGDR